MTAAVVEGAGGRCILGDVHLSRQTPVQSAPSGQVKVLAHGVLYGARPSHGPDAATLIAERYVTHSVRFADGLHGEFCAVILDEERNRLLVATDTVGNYPIYWRADADGLVFSSDLSALLKALTTAARLNLQAVADYLTIGAVLGRKTLAAGVELLDPGTVLVYDLRTACVSQQQYADIQSLFEQKIDSRAEYVTTVQRAFSAAVDRAIGTGEQMGLSLSGGLDSRAILSAVNGRAASLRTYTLGVPGCADDIIARQLSRTAGSQHVFFPLDRTYLRDFLPNMAEMVAITDGMYLSHGLTEMLAIRYLDQTGIEVLLRGHGGELAKAHLAWPLHTDARVYQLSSLDQLVAYLSERANYVTPGRALSSFLTSDAAAAAGPGARVSMSEALAGSTLTPAQACSYLYLRELNRRFTVSSLELFRTRVDVRLPFVDGELLSVLLGGQPEWRDDTTIHRALTAAGLPALLRIRNSNTGAPADAGPRTEFLLDKVNTALRRLHVRGYRHYHDFDAWMRTMLLESVEQELVSPRARLRDILDRQAILDLIRETRAGKADRGYLLQVLLILELWMRENGVAAAA